MNTVARSTLHLKREHTPKHTFYLKRRSRRSAALRGDEFMRRVLARMPNCDYDSARIATLATLEALGQYLSPPQARRMTARLPRELAESAARLAGRGGPATIESFYAELAAKADLPREEAIQYARAVAGVLRQTVPAGELSDTILKFPRELDELVA